MSAMDMSSVPRRVPRSCQYVSAADLVAKKVLYISSKKLIVYIGNTVDTKATNKSRCGEIT